MWVRRGGVIDLFSLEARELDSFDTPDVPTRLRCLYKVHNSMERKQQILSYPPETRQWDLMSLSQQHPRHSPTTVPRTYSPNECHQSLTAVQDKE